MAGLGFSLLTWARFVLHQDMQTVLRCHMAAFEAIGGVPNEILYDRMKAAVIGEAGGSVVYNRALVDFARHYGFQPKACRSYRAKTKGRSSGPIAIFARTSSSPARSATSTISMPNCSIG
jgi:transposase